VDDVVDDAEHPMSLVAVLEEVSASPEMNCSNSPLVELQVLSLIYDNKERS